MMTIHDMVAAAVFGAAVVATLLDEWYGVHDLASLRTVRAFFVASAGNATLIQLVRKPNNRRGLR